MREMDLSQCLKTILNSYEDKFIEKKITVSESIDESEMILGDSYRLEQLFTNLIENTLRYTDAPGQLNVTLERSTDYIIIEFKDSSPGVENRMLDKIFDRFFREELSRSREKGGAGLGLAICHEIAEAHSGKIIAESSDLGGLLIKVQILGGDS